MKLGCVKSHPMKSIYVKSIEKNIKYLHITKYQESEYFP